MSSLTLKFGNVELTPINQNDGQYWFTSKQLAEMLEYADDRAVSRIYNKHSDEFTDTMTALVKVTTPPKTVGLVSEMRVFSLRGCHLIAMFARSQKAKDFRVWVLDLIDKEIDSIKYQLPMGRLQQMRDENRARYAVGFSKASVGGKAMNEWKGNKRVLDAELLVIDNLMQPQLPNIEVLK